MNNANEQTNFLYLLVGLLLLFTLVPVLDELEFVSARVARGTVFSMLLLVGVWSLRGGGRYFSTGMTLAVLGVFLNVLAINAQSSFYYVSSIVTVAGFLLVAILYTFRQVAFGQEVNANRLVGAVCVYLLLGLIWALAYTLVSVSTPGAFTGFIPTASPGWDSEWVYFSFVTMTTLGYGDILPVSAAARTLAWLQAVVGQFYIAMLVAGLVGAYISDRQNKVPN